MKKYFRPMILALLIVVAGVMSTNAVKSVAVKKNNETVLPTEIVKASATAEFYLRDYDGVIAVFKGIDGKRPIETTQIETKTLNDVDRELLKRGIPAEDKQELLMLLEDFSS